MRMLVAIIIGWLVAGGIGLGLCQTVDGVRPLSSLSRSHLPSILPPGSKLLDHPVAIEAFLDALDGQPPDWAMLFGHEGHNHSERLFALNRERDRLREGRPALQQRVTFLWPGELSDYDPFTAGFRIAIGPAVIPTRWGLVRFKPDDLPSTLVAVPPPAAREALRRQRAQGKRIEVVVAMTGRLVPEESLIYDFAHEEAGRGMVMPVVKIERLDYLLQR
jgi:hypothetical protein